VVIIIARFGWRAAFIVFGVLEFCGRRSGISTIATRLRSTETSCGECELIGSGRKRSTEIPWRKILSHSNLWILAVMYFCYNFNLNVYNDWFPTYLHDSRGMTLAKMGLYASLPLFAGTLGDLSEAGFPIGVLRRTGNVNLARRWVAIAWFSAFGRGHHSRRPDARSRVSVAILLPGVLRAGVDGGNFLGGAAGHRRRFRRLSFRPS